MEFIIQYLFSFVYLIKSKLQEGRDCLLYIYNHQHRLLALRLIINIC